MSVDQLYQDAIMTHAKSGVGAGRLDQPSVSATVDNPLCGDRVTVDLAIADGVISQVGHKVRGCLLCEASAAILAATLPGTPTGEIKGVADSVAEMIRNRGSVPQGWADLTAFEPVREVPSRHECVLLPFEAARKAAENAAT
jgi:nitrogen fixation NifU-like protein